MGNILDKLMSDIYRLEKLLKMDNMYMRILIAANFRCAFLKLYKNNYMNYMQDFIELEEKLEMHKLDTTDDEENIKKWLSINQYFKEIDGLDFDLLLQEFVISEAAVSIKAMGISQENAMGMLDVLSWMLRVSKQSLEIMVGELSIVLTKLNMLDDEGTFIGEYANIANAEENRVKLSGKLLDTELFYVETLINEFKQAYKDGLLTEK